LGDEPAIPGTTTPATANPASSSNDTEKPFKMEDPSRLSIFEDFLSKLERPGDDNEKTDD